MPIFQKSIFPHTVWPHVAALRGSCGHSKQPVRLRCAAGGGMWTECFPCAGPQKRVSGGRKMGFAMFCLRQTIARRGPFRISYWEAAFSYWEADVKVWLELRFFFGVWL